MNFKKKNATKLNAVLATILPLALGVGLAACTSTDSPTSEATTAASGSENSAVQDLLNLGISEASENKVTEAQNTFNNVLALEPGNYFALYNLGVIAQNAGNNDEAISYYDQALSSNASYTPAMYNKAIIIEATDQKQAISLYEEIVGIDDQAATAYYRLSVLYEDQGDTQKADAARAKAVELDPTLTSE
ncbi:tetratricopeptide repeat protein [Lysinibacter sp. HNR]|uniref:tetratricopeptide repeat protein n=1 Tax=Lysinibacter sp. HNR TaxID=3031408 RepID=UPI002434B57C|nr:tetratricopeptide repeat protein [Lysinibacter sp. HNR]WGD38228.1 tetratricopeptide repeat protein [Lysinibacter sp. HNR]